MFRVLLLREILDHIKTFRFSAALLTMFVLVLISVWVLGADYVLKRNNYNQMAEASAASNEEVYVPSQFLPMVLRPMSALSIFARGEDAHLGSAVQVRRWEVPYKADDSLTANPLLNSMPSFDLLTVFIFTMSLFGVLLSYNSLSGEKETGTLKMLCSYSATRGLIYSVKFLAGVIVLAIPFIISILSALLVLQYAHNIHYSAEQWLAIGIVMLSSLFYGAFFIAVGMLCSTYAVRSSTSLALSLLIWAILVVIVPTMGTGLAKTLMPLLPEEEISNFEQETSTEVRENIQNFTESNSLNLSSMGSSGMGGETPIWIEGQADWLRDHMTFTVYKENLYLERAQKIWEMRRLHIARKRNQQILGDTLKSLSPAHHLRKTVKLLANTDYSNYESFLEQCRRYREAILDSHRNKGYFGRNADEFFSRLKVADCTPEKLQQRYEEYLRKRDAGDETAGRIEGFGKLPLDQFPAFQFSGSSPKFFEALVPLAVLVFFIIIAFLAGFVSFLRYDVR